MSDWTGPALTGPVTDIIDNVIFVDAQALQLASAQDEAVRGAAFYAASLAGLMQQLATELEQFSQASSRPTELGTLVASTRDFADMMERLSQTISLLPPQTDGTG